MAYRYNITKKLKDLLPVHYVQRCEAFDNAPPPPVHWRPAPAKYQVNPENGQKTLLCDDPIDVIYPAESNQGLWGGEGLVQGLIKRKKKKAVPRHPVLWRPMLSRRPLYSEILDRWMLVTVTFRTLQQIDDNYGFDYYILKTSERELNSRLAMDLKREMLLTLAKKSLYQNDPQKQEKIYEKYKQFLLPTEEAEWYGLPLKEALVKAKKLQEEANPIKPMKEMFAEQFIEELKTNNDTSEEDSGWLSKLNPFGKKEDQGDSKSS